MDKMELEFYEHFCDKLDDIIDLLHQALDKINAMSEEEINCEAPYVENVVSLYANDCLFCEASVEE